MDEDVEILDPVEVRDHGETRPCIEDSNDFAPFFEREGIITAWLAERDTLTGGLPVETILHFCPDDLVLRLVLYVVLDEAVEVDPADFAAG